MRATHHFLAESDLQFYKAIITDIDFTQFAVYGSFTENGELTGFLGVADHKLEMLFLKPAYMGRGLGKQLLEFALQNLEVTAVDVNEQNLRAIAFYNKFGFKPYDRTPCDSCGKPYPILKMKLETAKITR